ncbi:acyl-CoA dehydrogenase [Elioraea sp. Yellowstone]|jgi:hypothetical protein|uniref:DUF6285 domain-containing protein n=1 Tax=Elioraea sp. Yellowstone TaxID=2592070 RepID=UPI00114E154E|nr:DUF6285 domain-containing protein [Elioraea sp. Yellowstone]TQF77385.1 acyl-CoA dehydrogenase [Elioraea sp. Yellowstone]
MPLERPYTPDLLAIARATLLDEVLPALPEAQRFAVRMVANAIGIAARETALAGDARTALVARVAALTGEAADPLRALAAAIRAGAFDPGTERHAEAARLLKDLARLRCSVSAPKALGGG